MYVCTSPTATHPTAAGCGWAQRCNGNGNGNGNGGIEGMGPSRPGGTNVISMAHTAIEITSVDSKGFDPGSYPAAVDVRSSYRSPGALAGLTDTGIERSSAVRMMRVC